MEDAGVGVSTETLADAAALQQLGTGALQQLGSVAAAAAVPTTVDPTAAPSEPGQPVSSAPPHGQVSNETIGSNLEALFVQRMQESTYQQIKAWETKRIDEQIAVLNRSLTELERGTCKEYLQELARLETNASTEEWVWAHFFEQCKDEVVRECVEEKHRITVQTEKQRGELQESMLEKKEREKAAQLERYETLSIDNSEIGYSRQQTRKKLRRHTAEEEEQQAKVVKRDDSKCGPTVVWELADSDIAVDLAALTGKPRKTFPIVQDIQRNNDVFYEQDRLFYRDKWFYRGSKVAIDWQDGTNRRLVGMVIFMNASEVSQCAYTGSAVWIRTQDQQKVSIAISHLSKGTYTLRNSQGKFTIVDPSRPDGM